MNWTITSRTMPHTLFAGNTLSINVTGNHKEVKARLQRVVLEVTPMDAIAQAVSENGHLIEAKYVGSGKVSFEQS